MSKAFKGRRGFRAQPGLPTPLTWCNTLITVQPLVERLLCKNGGKAGEKVIHENTMAKADLSLESPLSSAFLIDIIRGNSESRYSPRQRSGTIHLLHCSRTPMAKASGAGLFKTHCYGMFNSKEESRLRLNECAIDFSRKDDNGVWCVNGSQVAKTKIGFARRQLYVGYSETTTNDGTTFKMKPPFLGPSSRQIFNCVTEVVINGHMHIRLYLARPSGQVQFIFDPSASELLAQLSEQARGVLLGEFLRIRALCSAGD
jgi:hypothetical protein